MIQYCELIKFETDIKHLSKNKDIYVAGAGTRGNDYGRYLDSIAVKWKGYVNIRSMHSKLNGKRVISYSEINNLDAIFIISSREFYLAIEKELLNVNIPSDNIFILHDDKIYIDMLTQTLYSSRYSDTIANIRMFKNKYVGQRCYIIGNGPSLKITDLEKLNSEISFASNSIYRLFDKTQWRPTFYMTHDFDFEMDTLNTKEEWMKIIQDKKCKAAFTTVMNRAFYAKDTWRLDKLFFYRRYPVISDIPMFSEDCNEWIYSCGSVTYCIIQLAIYMGFTTIYLLGIDNSYAIERKGDGTIITNNVKNHHELMIKDDMVLDRGKELTKERFSLPNVEGMTAGYKIAKEYADNHGIKIFNATRGGKLEVYTRVNFDYIVDKYLKSSK